MIAAITPIAMSAIFGFLISFHAMFRLVACLFTLRKPLGSSIV